MLRFIGWIQTVLLQIARSWRWFMVLGVLTLLAFRILFWLEERFTRLTGLPVYDTQNDLTTADIVEQLPLYQGAAGMAYTWFALFDFVFPLVASLFIAVVWAFLLRQNSAALAQRLLRWHLPVFPLIAALFDWLENLAILTVIWLTAAPWSIGLVIIGKQLKLGSLLVIGIVTWILVLFLLLNRGLFVWNRYFRAHKKRQP